MRKIKGPYGIVMTPFDANGKVEFDKLQQQVDRVCRSPIQGVVACGSTGEFSLLSFEENVEIAKKIKEAAGEKTVIGGATAGSIDTTCAYLDAFAKIGISAALTAPSYYLPMNDDDVIEYYKRLSDYDSGVDIVSYNIPAFTSPMSLKAFSEVIGFEHVSAVKDSGGRIADIMQEMEIRDAIRPDFSVLTGTDEAILAEIGVGCDGSFTACGYAIPEIVSLIYGNDPEKARKAERGVLRLCRLANSFTFPYGYKLIAKANGFDLGMPRQIVTRSMAERTPAVLAEMKSILRELYEI